MGELRVRAMAVFGFGWIFALVATLAGCEPLVTKTEGGSRILFVGNSLTYVGNLPAVLEALGASNGKKISTEMLVAGGATLTDRLNDGAVENLLDKDRYDYVVLQERGGDLVCDDTAHACAADPTFAASTRAHTALGQIIRGHHARTILLGTYQTMPTVSKGLEVNERILARQIDAIYIPISERLRIATQNAPDMNWFYSDGMHPGHDLTLAEAVWIYAALFKSVPSPQALRIDPFGPGAHINGSIPASRQHREVPAEPYVYEQQRVEKIITIAKPPL